MEASAAATAERLTPADLDHTGAVETGMQIFGPDKNVGGVFKKIAQVMGKIDRVAKRGVNAQQRYAYATEADIVDELRPVMAEVGIVMISHQSEERNEETARTQSGGQMNIVKIHHTFRFVDVEDGSAIQIGVWGEGFDTLDKASYKAFTGAEKYALLKTFLVATGDDPEDDGERADAGTKDRSKEKNEKTRAAIAEKRKINAIRKEIREVIDRMDLDVIFIGHFAQTLYGGENALLDDRGRVDVARLTLEQYEALLGDVAAAETAVLAGADVDLKAWNADEIGEDAVTIPGVAVPESEA